MTDECRELAEKFWDSLRESPFMMLGLKGSGFARPMTVHVGDNEGLYFFAYRPDELVRGIANSASAVATYASKGNDLFASIEGELVPDNDEEKIDRLWSPAVSAWYDKGRDDPDLILLRLLADKADVWEAKPGSAIRAAWIKLTGCDPARVADGQHARVSL